jgi:hypothetical protein
MYHIKLHIHKRLLHPVTAYRYNKHHHHQQKIHVHNIRILKRCILIYIYQGLSGHPNVYIQKKKKYICPQASATPRYNIDSPAYIQSNRYTIHIYQGASIAPPAAPPSGGGGGPPPPAPGGGGGTPAGPSCPGSRHTLVITVSTAAHRTIPRHGGGNPMHCFRNPSSWMKIHIGTSCNTVSIQQRISSKSTPAATGGACDGPALESSNRRLLTTLSSSIGHPTASSLHRFSPHGSLSSSRCANTLCNSTSRPRGAKSVHAQSNKQQIISVSIHHTYELIYQNIA